jgi:hypothetical protein
MLSRSEKLGRGVSSRQSCESCEVKVLVPPIACSRADSISMRAKVTTHVRLGCKSLGCPAGSLAAVGAIWEARRVLCADCSSHAHPFGSQHVSGAFVQHPTESLLMALTEGSKCAIAEAAITAPAGIRMNVCTASHIESMAGILSAANSTM